MYKFAVIGKGFIYPRHKQAIEAIGGKVLLTCDIDKKTKPHFTDWVEMFNHPKFKEVTHVSICTPNYLHSTITREALRLGKKVLCEKPLSINGTGGMEGVNTVLQLRYNPAVKMLMINPPKEMTVEAKMYRGKKYWKSWKGNPVKSGGVLYNLGVHYIDLLVHIFGEDWAIEKVKKTKKMVSGDLVFRLSDDDYRKAHFHIEVVDDRKKQGRVLSADGTDVILSTQDNLSYEDLHIEVYREFVAGRGINIYEAEPSLELIEEILNYEG